MKIRILSILCLLFGLLFSVSCSKDDDSTDREFKEGVRASHTFILSPDMLELADIVVEWIDFEGIIERDTIDVCKWEKDIVTDKLPNVTSFSVNFKLRDDVEIRTDRSYDLAILYNFSAVQLFSNGTGKALTSGRPIEDFTLMEMDIHKKFVERCLNRLPEKVTCMHYFEDSPFGMIFSKKVTYDE